jgi:hypothetical protein
VIGWRQEFSKLAGHIAAGIAVIFMEFSLGQRKALRKIHFHKTGGVSQLYSSVPLD